MSFLTLLGLILISLLGATVQGIAGMGFGLTTVPFFVWALGPLDGVSMGNLAGMLTALVVGLAQYKNINWRRFIYLFISSIPGVIVTVFVLSLLDQRLLSLILGILMLLIVFTSIFAMRWPPVAVLPASIFAGTLAGIVSAAVAQAGPVMAAYAQSTRWRQAEFSATLQPFFVMLNMVVLSSRYAVGGLSVEGSLSLQLIGCVMVAIICGVVISRFLAKHIPHTVARNMAITLGAIGALRVLVGALIG